MSFPLHTVQVLTGSKPLAFGDRLLMGVANNVATPASANAVTALGTITAGTGFSRVDTVSLAATGGTGSGLTAVPTSIRAVTATVNAGGSGYAVNDTITIAGGALASLTTGAASVLTVSSLRLNTASINAAGSGYAVNDTITLAGGTASVAAVITVTAVNAGQITAATVSTPGTYTVAPTSFTQASTSGSGTGATFNAPVWGVRAVTLTTNGAYSVAPPTAAAQGSTSGTGAGATFTMAYGLGTASITESGNYTAAPSMTVTDSAGGTGASIATATLGGNGNAIFKFVPFSAAPPYNVHVQPGMDCRTFVPPALKTPTGFTVALVPTTTGSTLAAGSFDATLID